MLSAHHDIVDRGYDAGAERRLSCPPIQACLAAATFVDNVSTKVASPVSTIQPRRIPVSSMDGTDG